MHRYWLFALPALIYLAAVCQTTVAPAMAIRDAVPNCFLLLAVAWCLAVPHARGAWLVAAAIGLGFDLVSPGRPGLGLAIFGGIALVLEWLARQWSLESLPLRCAVTAAAALTVELALVAAAVATGSPSAGGLWLAVRGAVYTVGVSIPLLMVLSWIPARSAA